MPMLFLSLFSCLAPDPAPEPREMIRIAVAELVKMQEDDGAWPYEGVYRVGGEIPVGYRVGGTAIACQALLYAAEPDDKAARAAIERGITLILKLLDHRLMRTSTRDTYDVRVWGHGYALDLFCRLRAANRMGPHRTEIESWIPKLVRTLLREELRGGGWNYAGRRQFATFVTAPIVQSLLWARAQGEKVPDDVFARARDALRHARQSAGTFLYSYAGDTQVRGTGKSQLPGSVARSAVCEATLKLLGDGSTDAVAAALDAFHKHWDELEKRRKKTGTHVPPYMIAPYYFYYGHRYAAQAIQVLPESDRPRERKRLLEAILRTRDPDGTWNDRVFERSRNFGTAMIVLALLDDVPPLPPSAPPSTSPASRPASAPSSRP